MDPGGPPRPAPSDAGGRGEASSSSSPPRPPPQQGHAIQPVPLRQASLPVDHGANAFPSGLESLERRMGEMYLRDSPHRAPVDASRSAVYGYGSSSPPPPQQQQQGHAIQPVWPSPPWGLGHALPFGFGPPVPGPIPPLHPQFASQQHPYWWSAVDTGTAARNFEGNSRPIPCYPPLGPTVWGASSNTSQYLDAMVAQQRSAAPTWPQQPQFGQHPPWFVPQPLQPPPIHQDWRLVEIRSELLRSPMTLEQLVMSPDREYSAILVHRLDVRDEEMRQMVLAGFQHCPHEIMGNRQGHAVFEALLRSIQVIVGDRRYEELQIIVEAAVTPNLVPRSNDGVTSLKLLITAVAWNAGLSTALVNRFLRDRVMDEVGGDELIAHCFTTMDYDVTKALVRHAMDTIDDKLKSSFGLACLGTCFWHATGEELPLFQNTLVERAVPMAMGRDSNRLVQRLTDRGSIEFRRQLLSRLMQHVVSLSDDWYGRFVLGHCFLSEEGELQPVVLTACADLPQGDVQALVMQFLPLHRVLQRGNTDFPAIARRLARKIEALPPHIREHDDLKLLMRAVTRVLADNLANLGD